MKLTEDSEQHIINTITRLRQANHELNKVQHKDSDVMAIQFEIAKIMNKIRETYLEENKWNTQKMT